MPYQVLNFRKVQIIIIPGLMEKMLIENVSEKLVEIIQEYAKKVKARRAPILSLHNSSHGTDAPSYFTFLRSLVTPQIIRYEDSQVLDWSPQVYQKIYP